MDREHLARAAVAAGIFALVVAAVCGLWFVLPSSRGGSVAVAQEEPGAAGGAEGGSPSEPSAPGASPAAPGEASGGPGAAPAGAGSTAPVETGTWSLATSPLEPSRPNPFAPIDTPEAEVKFRTSAVRYGIDWSRQPLGMVTNLPQPNIPAAPPAPLPPNPTPLADMVRVSSVVWPQQDLGAGAPGRAFATYEDAEGRTRLAAPGGQIVVTNPDTRESQRWRVVGVEPEAVILRNSDTGEQTRMPVQPRSGAEKRYWGAKRMSDDLSQGTTDKRVVPGRGAVLPGGAAAAQSTQGAAGMEAGSGSSMP